MRKTPLTLSSLNRSFTIFAAGMTALGFILSLVMALVMLVLQGNPAFLIFWIVAVAAAARVSRSWLSTIKGLRAKPVTRTFHRSQASRDTEVIDVVFKDLSSEQISLSH